MQQVVWRYLGGNLLADRGVGGVEQRAFLACGDVGHVQACAVAGGHLHGSLGGCHAGAVVAQACVPEHVGGVGHGLCGGCVGVDDILSLGMHHHAAGLVGKDAAQGAV